MPVYASREKGSLGDEFLRIIFSKMSMLKWRAGVESEDVSCRLKFRDGDESDDFVGG